MFTRLVEATIQPDTLTEAFNQLPWLYVSDNPFFSVAFMTSDLQVEEEY